MQGAITGGIAGFTGGASLVTTVGVSAVANVAGGAVNNLVQGKDITVKSVATDAAVGAAAGLGGQMLEKGLNSIQVAKAGKVLASLATDAKANVTAATGIQEGEKGFGTAAYTEFKNLVDASNLKNVSTEKSFKNDLVVKYGTAGSVRADVVLQSSKGSVLQIWDLKTGSAILSAKQTTNYIQNVPGVIKPSQITAIH